MLLNIYFNYNMNNFEGSKRDLIRNKVKKKIYGALRMKSRSRQDKMKVIGLQGKMWVKFKNNKQDEATDFEAMKARTPANIDEQYVYGYKLSD